MLVRSMLVVVVGAVLAAPAAVAVDTASLLLFSDLPDAADAQARHTLAGGAARAEDAADRAAASVQGLLDCKTAVEVHLTGWGGTALERRHREAEILTTRGFTETVERLVPVERTVTETVPVEGPLGLVRQVAREVRVVDHVLETEEVTRSLDLAVHLTWGERRIDWERVDLTVLVAVPAGLAHLGPEAPLRVVCDGSTILPEVPDIARGHDVFSLTEKEDGWYAELLSVGARLASPEDLEHLPWGDAEGTVLCPLDVLRQSDTRVAQMRPDDMPGVPAALAAPSAEDGPAEPDAAAQVPQGPTVVAAPTVAMLGALAALLAALAAAARRLR